MHRQCPISVALYDLHKIKLKQLSDKKKNQESDQLHKIEEEVQKSKNSTSSQYLCQRFEREYRIVIENMAKEE